MQPQTWMAVFRHHRDVIWCNQTVESESAPPDVFEIRPPSIRRTRCSPAIRLQQQVQDYACQRINHMDHPWTSIRVLYTRCPWIIALVSCQCARVCVCADAEDMGGLMGMITWPSTDPCHTCLSVVAADTPTPRWLYSHKILCCLSTRPHHYAVCHLTNFWHI